MNKSSLFKVSLVCATVLVAVGATLPQKVLAQETGTIPIIKAPPLNLLSSVKDNGTIPIIANPSSTDVTAPPAGGCAPDNETFTLEITVNAPVTENTALTLLTDHPEAIGLSPVAVVTPGSSTVTTTVSVTPGYAEHHKNVKILVSCNGASVLAVIRVHYHGEND